MPGFRRRRRYWLAGLFAVVTAHLPPTACEGMIQAIARARGVAADNILPGAGSSDLIFRALRHWLQRLRTC